MLTSFWPAVRIESKTWCCCAEDLDAKSPTSQAEMDRRVFGMPTCCGPDPGKPGEDGCCYKPPDGEVITIDSSDKGNVLRSVKPVIADCIDEHNGALVDPAEASKVLQARSRAPPANFSGSWRCSRVDGDMEAFLTDMGLGGALRRAASTANYGAGVQVQNISQMGDFFEVENILRTPVTMHFRVGDGEQSTVDQVGKPIVVDPRWEGSALHVASRKETGEPIADSKRYYVGDSMVIQFRSPQGTVVERVFDRNLAGALVSGGAAAPSA